MRWSQEGLEKKRSVEKTLGVRAGALLAGAPERRQATLLVGSEAQNLQH